MYPLQAIALKKMPVLATCSDLEYEVTMNELDPRDEEILALYREACTSSEYETNYHKEMAAAWAWYESDQEAQWEEYNEGAAIVNEEMYQEEIEQEEARREYLEEERLQAQRRLDTEQAYQEQIQRDVEEAENNFTESIVRMAIEECTSAVELAVIQEEDEVYIKKTLKEIEDNQDNLFAESIVRMALE